MSEGKKPNWFKRHKILTGVLAFVLLLLIVGASNSKNQPPTTTASTTTVASAKTGSTDSEATTSNDSNPGLNQAARDGKFQFTIGSFQCNVSSIGESDTGDSDTTGSPYCEMALSVKDIGTVGQTFEDDAQYVYSASGNQYSVDDDATVSANGLSNNCMEDPTVNPGVTITCTLAYDVPASATPSYAMLHDSSLSNGVKVMLQ